MSNVERILEQINSPQDLQQLSEDQLPHLAEEIREFLLSTLSKTGGHLASNLGVVELTIALHYSFDAPKDKIIWDVGHQAYTHKILTGRREQFHTIRQKGGLSGYCKRDESPYDVFGAGHSSTSVSAALGIAEARDLRGEQYNVIAVIGDGSLTAGLALEALNNAGAKRRKFIVVLNDNEMSISRNVGALSVCLNRIITGSFYNRLKGEIEHFVKTIPGIGEAVFKLGKRFDEYFKGFITPGMLFGELGFKYVGPIHGHNIHQLVETFRNVRDNIDRPTLIHVVTRKGKGYQQAEQDATMYHGASPFCIDTGQFVKQENAIPSYTEVFGETLVKLAQENDQIVAITAAMCSGTGLEQFAAQFPQRFYDVGIAEQHAVTFAAGMATQGFRPVAAIYSSFLQRAYDQVFHDVCLQNLPVTFALDRAGVVGSDGPTHHGVFDFSYLRHLPKMVIMAPKDENELQHMLKTALEYPGPTALRYPRGAGLGVLMDAAPHTLSIGKAELLRNGDDLAILAIGTMVQPAMEAAKNLQEDEHISATVVNARFVKPLDAELILDIARKTGKIITVEENVIQGGFGSAVMELLQAAGVDAVSVRCLGFPDQFIEHGTQNQLRRAYGLDAEGIEKAARVLMK
ncbi:1-deoxy-D-xylulose-5-phosphate synthase 2 [Candidatus Vecturithrix granuli]|uniref:1-deoxy-D-xylulose-5-phosphate synthase n=1 Tax=Vecturithrix granuli TaxID=1499967 RepID=A0A081C533_VECG1|nr:1-deoxy-D-xylulose-5-phosphate synthase 2 [Candidatus Vecturithrix granuli]